jgi:type IV pilus assembly protein PilC
MIWDRLGGFANQFEPLHSWQFVKLIGDRIKRIRERFVTSKTLSKREIARFCEQFKMLLSSGVPILEALQIIDGMSARRRFSAIIERLADGSALAQALRDYFPPMVVSSIAGAEKAGNLEEVLGQLAKYYEARAEVEEKIKSAMVYPSFVLILCFMSLFVLFAFVLPGFKSLFLDMGADLPLITLAIMNGGDIIAKVWYLPLVMVVVLGLVFVRFRKSSRGAGIIDGLALRFTSISRQQIMQSFRTLGSLLQGGIPIIGSLKTTAESIGNKAFQKIFLELREAIENGERMSDVLSRYRIFPREMLQMIAVGENSGKLPEMLVSIADFNEKEREVFIKRFTALLEPCLTLAVGIVVGIIALAMFLPMVNMISGLQ